MRYLLPMLGLTYVPTDQLVVFFTLAAISLFLFGWLSDIILQEAGFGIVLNSLILAAGAMLGFMLWNRLGHVAGSAQPHATTLVIATSSVLLLISCGIGKRCV